LAICLSFIFLILVALVGIGLQIIDFTRTLSLSNLDHELGPETLLPSEIGKEQILVNTSPAQLDQLARDWAARLRKRIDLLLYRTACLTRSSPMISANHWRTNPSAFRRNTGSSPSSTKLTFGSWDNFGYSPFGDPYFSEYPG
jgi:hypothetical protein